MSQGSVSHNIMKTDKDRMTSYKYFASVFIYPDEKFFKIFPSESNRKAALKREYDQLFRAREVWLYGAEYTLKNEFQRANYLADIMGFYKAFGVDTDKDRPDLLSNELEFMYYLIFKKCHAAENKDIEDPEEKAAICVDAQKKFFKEHLYPAAKGIAEKIISVSEKKSFYADRATELLEFAESEKNFFEESQ